MNASQTAALDQRQAAAREFDRRVLSPILTAIVVMFLALGVGLMTGLIPAAPWSPMGEYQQQQVEKPAPAPVRGPSVSV